MIRLPKIKTAELSTYGNFAKCHGMDMEGDDAELKNSDCLPRLDCWKTYNKVSTLYVYVSSYFAHVITRRGIYSRAAFISSDSVPHPCLPVAITKQAWEEFCFSSTHQEKHDIIISQ